MSPLIPVPDRVIRLTLKAADRSWVPFPGTMAAFPDAFSEKIRARLAQDHKCVVVHPAKPDIGVFANVRHLINSTGGSRYWFQFLWRVRVFDATAIYGKTPEDFMETVRYEALPPCQLSKEVFLKGGTKIQRTRLLALYIKIHQASGDDIDREDAKQWIGDPESLMRFIYNLANYTNDCPFPFIEELLANLLAEDNPRQLLERAVQLLGYIFQKMVFNTEDEKIQSTRMSPYGAGASPGGGPTPQQPGQAREDPDDKDLPPEVFEVVKRELSGLSDNPSAENQVILKYVDILRRVGRLKLTKDQSDFNAVQTILDEDHYGLDKVKNGILEYLAEQQLNAKSRGTILCLVGPPGVGKTSLGKSIARSLGRSFIRQSLGGMRDEAEIRGHRRTYIGSRPGRVIKGLTTAGTLNPVFMLDEIDKLGHEGFQGSPQDALLEVLDPEQNHAFTDHYMEIPVNLSHVLFIATANTDATIPHALLDRMEMVYLSGYSEEEKLVIARKYLIPKQLSACGLVVGESVSKVRVNVSDSTLSAIVRGWTREAGVRSLERRLRKIFRKIGFQFLKKDAAVSSGTIDITPEILPQYLGAPRGSEEIRDIANLPAGVATLLSVDGKGEGSIGFIEVSTRPYDHLKMKITGGLIKSMQEMEESVMKESVEVAMTRVMHSNILTEDQRKTMEKTFFHIHFDSGAVPKDGPSAGVMIAIAIASAIKNVPVKARFGGTGEISMRRNVILPIGGVREKILAAARDGLREVFIPKANERDIDDLPPEFKKRVHLATLKKDESAKSKTPEIQDGILVYSLETPEQAFELAFEIPEQESEIVFP